MPEKARINRLREKMSALEVDAFFVSQPESRRYLSGFTGYDHPPMDSAGYLLITESDAFLLTDGRTTEQAERQAIYFEVCPIVDGLPKALSEVMDGLDLKRIAFEGNHLSYRNHGEMKGVIDSRTTLVPTYDLIDQMRAIKEPDELAAIRDAVTLADSAFVHLLGIAQVGVSERDLAWELESYLRRNGSEGVAFEPIVASGPNASMAHHTPGDRPIQAGEPIIVDWGARVRGYCSDITRTIVLGSPNEKLATLYTVVLEAQERAEARIQAGITGAKADGFARKSIEEAGYGDQFTHSLGHGVGLAIHESPKLGRTSEDVLQDGMVFSIEPGIYLPGWGGIRIEDLATLEGGRIVVLTRAPKQLEAMEV